MDLSGSTNGLIDDLRDHIYDILNYSSSIRPEPKVRIGMVGFARPSFGKKNHYVSVLSDLTNDFERIQNQLHDLKPFVEKGDQFVGNAILECVKQIQWSQNDNDIRLLFLVGNGLVNTGSVDYAEATELARQKGITMVPVYCDKANNKLKEISGWMHIAEIHQTTLHEIKIHKAIPMNFLSNVEYEKLHILNQQLNETYIPYGDLGNDFYKSLTELDKKAGSAGRASMESRMFYKLSDKFQNRFKDVDLVDFIMSSRKSLEDIPGELLPDSLKNKNTDELYKTVLAIKERRLRTIREMRKLLPYDRQKHLNEYYRENKNELSSTLFGTTILNLEIQAKQKGFSTVY